jgi:hypothetical protein
VAEINSTAAADEVRALARMGVLAEVFRNASPDRRRELRAGAGQLAVPLLFQRVTRLVERRFGHHRCASGLRQMAPDCLDRFHDDLDAVLDHVFANANRPIENFEGWLTTRLHPATVDGYRRRRGQRGAPQRPRVPVWLADELGGVAWLLELATAILEWAGTDATPGLSPWPYGAWARLRADRTGDQLAGEAVVAREVDLVLAAMGKRPAWYQKNVEGPLGHKRAPVWYPSRSADGTHAEPVPLVPAAHEHDDALLRELAADAIEAISRRLERGEDPESVVTEVIEIVFGRLPASYGSDRAPGRGDTAPEQVIALIEDPDRRERIVAAVLRLLTGPDEVL